jgi:hypothetical protein
MMLPDPEFVVVKFIEQFGELEIALQLERRMLPDWMMRREEHAKSETLGHYRSPSIAESSRYIFTELLGCADGAGAADSAGFGDSIGAGDAVDPETAGGGGDAGDATGVGTETVGIASGDVGAASGLAASDGTGAAAISAVPAP